MRMAQDFTPARTAAVHCDELIRRGPRPEERAAMIAAWRRDLARLLADDLSALLSGDRLDVSITEPERLSGAEALRRIGPLAANSLIRCAASAETALLSFDFATAIALTDRSFGGDGRVTGNIPETLPRSAALLVEETATMIAGAITTASFGDMPPPAGFAARGEVIVRSESAARLKPFAMDDDTLFCVIEIANRKGSTWRAALVVAEERLARLLPGGERRKRPRTRHVPATGLAAPFADMPLPLHVVLAEFNLSLGRLQALQPGDTIPLTVGRQVPLLIGETLVAHGAVGTAEDRMAVRLTRLAQPSPAPFPNPHSATAEGLAP